MSEIEPQRSPNRAPEGMVDWISLVAFQPGRELEYQEFEDIGAYFQLQAMAATWHLGDWSIYGDTFFPETWYQAVTSFVDNSTLTKAMTTARAFPPDTRKDSLSFEHHAIVAAKVKDSSIDEKLRWLAFAEEGRLSPAKLAVAIRDYFDSVEVDEAAVTVEPEDASPVYSEALVRISVRVPYQKATQSADAMDTIKRDITLTLNGHGVPVLGVDSGVSFS